MHADGASPRHPVERAVRAPQERRLETRDHLRRQATFVRTRRRRVPHEPAAKPFVVGVRTRRTLEHVVDLARGGPLWTVSVSLPDGEASYLDAVLRHEDRTWLLVRPRGGDDDREACLFELHAGVGQPTRIHGLTLSRNEHLLGAESGRTHVLDMTQVFVRSEEQGGAVHRLRTHDLLTGARLWAWSLGSNRELYNRRWPQPAVSANAVAIVFTEKGPRMRTNLLCMMVPFTSHNYHVADLGLTATQLFIGQSRYTDTTSATELEEHVLKLYAKLNGYSQQEARLSYLDYVKVGKKTKKK